MREKWQPACLAGNLKSIRYKRALTSALVKFSLKKSYFHFFISSKFCKTPNHQLVSFSFKAVSFVDLTWLLDVTKYTVRFVLMLYKFHRKSDMKKKETCD
jgi:hypothetical protein